MSRSDQQLDNVVPGFAPENPVFMLQTHQIDIFCIQEFGGFPVGRDIAFADLKPHPLGVQVG